MAHLGTYGVVDEDQIVDHLYVAFTGQEYTAVWIWMANAGIKPTTMAMARAAAILALHRQGQTVTQIAQTIWPRRQDTNTDYYITGVLEALGQTPNTPPVVLAPASNQLITDLHNDLHNPDSGFKLSTAATARLGATVRQ